MLKERNLDKRITCDSAGTISQHQGSPPDHRMQKAAQNRNIHTTGSARMITQGDFAAADLLVTMDDFNFSELTRLAPDERAKGKIRPFCDFVSTSDVEVPDPYYGGSSGFEKVLDLLEDGCVRLIDELETRL